MKINVYRVPIEPIGSMSQSLKWERAVFVETLSDEVSSENLTLKAKEVADFNKSRVKMWSAVPNKPESILQRRIQ